MAFHSYRRGNFAGTRMVLQVQDLRGWLMSYFCQLIVAGPAPY
uniref:Uncharacterized protein n=1 Tax=Arundo donax TaxID=35708 RepID=A0A0A8Z7Y7_ARUDO